MSKQRNRIKGKARFRVIPRPRIYRDEEISLSNAKVNIHIRLDADVVGYFKEKAIRERGKYQSLINQHLRETVFKERNLENRLQRVEERLGIG